MIQLELTDKPIELTAKVQKELTDKFIDSDKSTDVWNTKFIREAVKKLAFGKCCFSEIKLDTKSTYTEIEHFYPKDLYPNEVVKWGNLLPSSKKCNTTKGKTDIKKETIINPFFDNPKEHLYFENFRLYPKDNSTTGKNTISIVALNDRLHFVSPRSEVSLKVLDLIEDFYIEYIENDGLSSLTPRKKVNRLNRIKGYFSDINRKTEFSACISSAVKDSINFTNIISYLKENNYWDEDFEKYETEILFCYLGK
ncbi:hypothetical protein G1K75_07540 [Tenacibaculum finnmarkense]|uniref:hypothetical protein n=1 Tax=Tenacibaculum finnmarkense TaxID=2781243 RepID=UPI001EFA5278|nr:hypothetical protein [Tenacibaculum finnmarkense]MCG8805508.1 hypothetical protein [Tenacibaculum finnmarkense]MCG8856751.1 hypothetical protein [Tenacibaculum finnmarkense]